MKNFRQQWRECDAGSVAFLAGIVFILSFGFGYCFYQYLLS